MGQTPLGYIQKPRQLTCCLATLSGNDFAGSIGRHLTKLISHLLLRQCNGLMTYNKVEWGLVINKQIFNYYNTDFSLPNTTFRYHLYVFSLTITEWNAQNCGISKAVKDTSMLPSIIDQIKVSQEAGYQDNYGFECGLMPFYLEVCPLKAAFSGFQTQP